MIANRIHLTPKLRAKLHAKAQATARADEKLFLIHLRLSELALLLPLKQLAVAQIRKRMIFCGPSPRLERELAEHQEQIQDLSQLAKDWLIQAECIFQSAAKPEALSEPIQNSLQKLGVDFECSSTTYTNSQSAQ